MIGLVPLKEETPESLSSFSAMRGQTSKSSKKTAIYISIRRPLPELENAGTLMLDFQPSKL